MARSRSGTRNTRGPRKPQRRVEGSGESTVQTIDPSVRGSIDIPASITVKELAELIGVNPADIIRELIKSGIFANINQVIDRDTASLVTSDLGYEVAEARARGSRRDERRRSLPWRPPRRSSTRRTSRATCSRGPRS